MERGPVKMPMDNWHTAWPVVAVQASNGLNPKDVDSMVSMKTDFDPAFRGFDPGRRDFMEWTERRDFGTWPLVEEER